MKSKVLREADAEIAKTADRWNAEVLRIFKENPDLAYSVVEVHGRQGGHKNTWLFAQAVVRELEFAGKIRRVVGVIDEELYTLS